MALTKASLSQIPTCYATCSLGRPSDPLPSKIKAISSAGFNGIELAFPDLQAFASSRAGRDVGAEEWDALCEAASEVKKLCQELRLEILILQPFSNFEGWKGQKEMGDAFERAKGWIRIMEAAGTDMLQLGSTDTDASKLDTSRSRIVADLQALSDLLAPHGFRLAYENWCWSTHAPTWKDVWEIVEAVNRPNVGLCLDSFQTAGSEWADPTTESGLIESKSKEDLEKSFAASLEELSKTVPPSKIFFLQISDAYKPVSPFSTEADESGLRPRGRWSHDFRPYPFNGGYLPVVQVVKAVLKTGFRGYFSMEIFDGGREGKGKEYDLQVFAKEAMQSHQKLLEECAED